MDVKVEPRGLVAVAIVVGFCLLAYVLVVLAGCLNGGRLP
mgnify:CR=1 FL=1